MSILEPLDDGKTVEAGHLHVKENQVGVVFLNQVDRFNAVGALGYNVDAAQSFEQVLELIASQLFVIDDEGGKRHPAVEARL